MGDIILKLLGPVGIGTSILALILGVMLAVQKGETRHWKKQSAGFETLYHQEQTAHTQTVANYRTAAETARQADAANKARVEADQAAINKERDASYEARIAAARANAERLSKLTTAAANPGSPAAAPVPGVPTAAGGPNGPPAEARFRFALDDQLTASEQAIQLDELQRWVKSQSSIPVNSPSSSRTESH